MSEYERLVLLAQRNEHLYLNRAMEANNGMLVDVLNKTSISGMGRADLFSELRIAMINAIRGYKRENGEGRGANGEWGKWSTYLMECLRNRVAFIMLHKKRKERWKMDAVAVEVYEGMDSSTTDFHSIFWPIDGLSAYDGVLLELFYVDGWTYKEMAKILFCDYRQIGWKLKCARKNARALLK